MHISYLTLIILYTREHVDLTYNNFILNDLETCNSKNSLVDFTDEALWRKIYGKSLYNKDFRAY